MSVAGVTMISMRPALKAGLLPVWRDGDTVQIGIDPRRAVAITGVGRAAAVLTLLDGSRDWADVVAAAERLGVPTPATTKVLTLLAAVGALHDFPAHVVRALPEAVWARLAPELAAVSLAYGDGDGGARTLARRRNSFVRVHGGGRIGACVAPLLAASGVGHVACRDSETTRPGDLAPGGLCLGDLDLPRDEGVARAVQRIAPEVRTDDDGQPALVVLTEQPNHEHVVALMREGVPHLTARAGEAIGVVGPLVHPGRSACLRCLDLARAQRDRAWPLILAQVSHGGREPAACDAVLAAAVATSATAQALAFIDTGVAEVAAVNGTLELTVPDWRWRRRTWAPHPACTCAAATAQPGADSAGTVSTTPRDDREC